MMSKSVVAQTSKHTRALLAGVDTLIINVKQVDGAGVPKEAQLLPDGMETLLTDWQEIAQQNEDPLTIPWQHEGIHLQMWPKGAGGWKWLFKNGLVDVLIGAQLNKSTLVRVRFSSEYLWKRGVTCALKNTHAFLSKYFGEGLFLQVAEMHLCADMVGLVIPKDYERVFVSRAKVTRPVLESYLNRPVYRHSKLETLQFSGHGSPMSMSIYNKPKEIQVRSHEKVWFYDLWQGKGYRKGEPLWRIEARFKRHCLREMEIEDASEALSKAPALWAYAVGHVGEHNGWLRMVKPNPADSNRWRWQTAEGWCAVQQAFLECFSDGEDIDALQRERKREINMDQAEAAIAGYVTTYSAWDQDIGPQDDVSVVLRKLYDQMIDRWERKGLDFQYLRRKKQFDYHIP